MIAGICLVALAAAAAPGKLDTAAIDRATGLHGAHAADGAYRVELPRTELDVYSGSSHVTAPQGLTAWAAFQKGEKGTIVVADLVLLEDQLDPAVGAALAGGLEIAGIDHHFTNETPRIIDLHVIGQGSESSLAATVGKLFEVVKSKTSSGGGPKLAELDTGKPAHTPFGGPGRRSPRAAEPPAPQTYQPQNQPKAAAAYKRAYTETRRPSRTIHGIPSKPAAQASWAATPRCRASMASAGRNEPAAQAARARSSRPRSARWSRPTGSSTLSPSR